MDVHAKLRRMMQERNWSEYRLSKEAGLSQSTISNLFRRNTVPGITTLEALCKAFGISLAQFFSEDAQTGLTEEQASLLHTWSLLTEAQRTLLTELMKTMV